MQQMPVVLGQGYLLTGNSEETKTKSWEVLQRWNIFYPLDKMGYELSVPELIRSSKFFP